MSNRMKQTVEHVKTLKKFMSKEQIATLAFGCRDREEKEFFFDKIEELATTFNTMPKVYESDGLGDKAIVHLHYFHNNMDWFILEKDIEDEQIQAFGYCDLGMGMPELGYVSLVELAENNVEVDLYWEPKTLKEVKESRK